MFAFFAIFRHNIHMDFAWLQSYMPYFATYGYWLIFIIMFLEALTVVGAIVPGVIFIIFVATLAGIGTLNIYLVFLSSFSATILGDVVSYIFGRQGKYFIQKYPNIFQEKYIALAEEYFRDHGNKSVFLARFIGPMRNIMPFVAGVMHMKPLKFFYFNILASLIWITFYLLLGYLFSGIVDSVLLWTDKIGEWIFVVIILFIIFWFLRKRWKNFLGEKNNLKIGERVPYFSLFDQNGERKTLEDFHGKTFLLYFYPMDGTPGCTRQACGLRNSFSLFQENGVEILGISADSIQSHKSFAEKHNLPFLLLSDPKKEIIALYNAKGFFTRRISYLIDEKGILLKAYYDVDTLLHAKEILEDLDIFKKIKSQ